MWRLKFSSCLREGYRTGANCGSRDSPYQNEAGRLRQHPGDSGMLWWDEESLQFLCGRHAGHFQDVGKIPGKLLESVRL